MSSPLPLSAASPGPISPGNIVNAALTCYRADWRNHMALSLRSVLWGLIPIYGIGKSSALQSAIACGVYKRLTGNPESVEETLAYVNPHVWRFLFLNIRVGFYVLLCIIANYVGLLLITIVLVTISSYLDTSITNSFVFLTTIGLIYVGLFLGAGAIVVGVYSRMICAEMFLVLESGCSVSASLGRSWKLSRGSILHMQSVITIASIITLGMISGLSVVVLPIVGWITYHTRNIVFGQVSVGLLWILISPFWQSLKAVIYYDLRCRKEGLDMILPSVSYFG